MRAHELAAGDNARIDTQFLENAVQAWAPNCKQGIVRDCTQLGVSVLALGDRQLARRVFVEACGTGDPWAWELARHPRVR